MTDFAPIAPGELNRYLDEFAVEVLQNYFNSGKFSGGGFERFAGGGDQPDTANEFTSDDIVAASFLSIRIPGRAAIEILDNRADEFAALLADIPTDVDLWDAPDDMVGPGSAAQDLWSRLAELPGMSWNSAGKLLARKRPRLIPVYDRVLRNSLGRKDEDGWWLPLRDALAKRPALVAALTETRDLAQLKDISLLRIIDVSIWMRGFGRPEPAPDAET
jgi:hypothetical protein